MSLCINSRCLNPSDPLNIDNVICRHCGWELLLQKRYRVIRLVNDDGGFGNVYEVDDRGIPRILKVLKEHLSSQPKALELFQKEVYVLSQLRHPGIPTVEADGYFTFSPRNSSQIIHCLVMERIDGLNLEQWMNEQENQPITQLQAFKWLRQLTQILEQVHRHDYFHRDIKPSNIMCRWNGQLVLIDFGTARAVTGTYLAKIGGDRNITGVVSVGYTPPEQANGKPVPQSDFFALGRTFVYLLTGQHPNDFEEDPRTGKLLWKHSAKQVSKPFTGLIDYLMAPFPGNRPQTTRVILQCLAEIERDWRSQPLSQPQYVPPSLPTIKQTNNNSPKSDRAKLFLGSGMILGVIVGMGYAKFTGQSPQPIKIVDYSSYPPQNSREKTLQPPLPDPVTTTNSPLYLPKNIPYNSSQPTEPSKLPEVGINNTWRSEREELVSTSTGINYSRLRDLLAEGNWQDADLETTNLMLKVPLTDNFPCEDLRTIDELWLKSSYNRFGFSVQQKIWESINRYEKGDVANELFLTTVGWLNDSYSNFSLEAPAGHLPTAAKEYIYLNNSLLARVKECKL